MARRDATREEFRLQRRTMFGGTAWWSEMAVSFLANLQFCSSLLRLTPNAVLISVKGMWVGL